MKSVQSGNFSKRKRKKLKPLFINTCLLLIYIFIISGCEKEEEPFKSYLRMTLDGEMVECDHYVRASRFVPPNTSPTQVLGIYGTWQNNNQDEGNIEIELYEFDNVIGEKEFNSPSYFRVMLEDGDYFASGNDVNLIIDEVSEQYVKGTFNATVKKNTGPGTFESKIITDGELHINRDN